MGEPGLYGKRLWRRGTTASVREDGVAQICSDSLMLMKTASFRDRTGIFLQQGAAAVATQGTLTEVS